MDDNEQDPTPFIDPDLQRELDGVQRDVPLDETGPWSGVGAQNQQEQMALAWLRRRG